MSERQYARVTLHGRTEPNDDKWIQAARGSILFDACGSGVPRTSALACNCIRPLPATRHQSLPCARSAHGRGECDTHSDERCRRHACDRAAYPSDWRRSFGRFERFIGVADAGRSSCSALSSPDSTPHSRMWRDSTLKKGRPVGLPLQTQPPLTRRPGAFCEVLPPTGQLCKVCEGSAKGSRRHCCLE